MTRKAWDPFVAIGWEPRGTSHTDVIIVLLLLTPSVNYHPPLVVWPKKVKATCREHLSFRKKISVD